MSLSSNPLEPNMTGVNSADQEKKIEFAQKLPTEEIEGKEAAKAGSFDFLKNFEPRKPGEPAAVKIAHEAVPLEEEFTGERSAADNEPKNVSWLIGWLKGALRREKDSSRVLEVNLVKGEIVKFFDWQRGILIILVAVFATMTVLSMAYWGISWWESSSQSEKNNNYLQQYYKLSKQIRNESASYFCKVLAFKNKLDQVNFLLERHIYWTNFFSFLEDNTLSNVYFSGFSGMVNGTYSLSAVTDNFDAIRRAGKKTFGQPVYQECSG